jgi:hypothetical protein
LEHFRQPFVRIAERLAVDTILVKQRQVEAAHLAVGLVEVVEYPTTLQLPAAAASQLDPINTIGLTLFGPPEDSRQDRSGATAPADRHDAMDTAAMLARAKVPLMHVCGDAAESVPFKDPTPIVDLLLASK